MVYTIRARLRRPLRESRARDASPIIIHFVTLILFESKNTTLRSRIRRLAKEFQNRQKQQGPVPLVVHAFVCRAIVVSSPLTVATAQQITATEEKEASIAGGAAFSPSSSARPLPSSPTLISTRKNTNSCIHYLANRFVISDETK